MPFSLSFRRLDDHLRFEVSGARVPGTLTDDMVRVWTDVAAECRASGLDRVLGVNRLTGPAPSLEVFQIGRQVPAILGGAVRKLAFVIAGGDEAMRANLFFENVAVNRGLDGRVFEDEAKALEWLLAR